MTTRQKVEQIFKRLDNLDKAGIKVILSIITDFNSKDIISFRIRAIDKKNKILQEEYFKDTPIKYITKFKKIYNIDVIAESLQRENGKLIPTYKDDSD